MAGVTHRDEYWTIGRAPGASVRSTLVSGFIEVPMVPQLRWRL